MQDKIEVMQPLYAPEGGPARAFVCQKCSDVTRTKKGMWAHLRVVHGIMKQAKLKFENANDERTATTAV